MGVAAGIAAGITIGLIAGALLVRYLMVDAFDRGWTARDNAGVVKGEPPVSTEAFKGRSKILDYSSRTPDPDG